MLVQPTMIEMDESLPLPSAWGVAVPLSAFTVRPNAATSLALHLLSITAIIVTSNAKVDCSFMFQRRAGFKLAAKLGVFWVTANGSAPVTLSTAELRDYTS